MKSVRRGLNIRRALLGMAFALLTYVASEGTWLSTATSRVFGTEPGLVTGTNVARLTLGVEVEETPSTDVEGDSEPEAVTNPARNLSLDPTPLDDPAPPDPANDSEPPPNSPPDWTATAIADDGPPIPDAPSIPRAASEPMQDQSLAASQTDSQPLSETVQGTEIPVSFEETMEAGQTPVSELPAVGRPEVTMLASVYVGTCDTANLGVNEYTLNDLIFPGGEVVGSIESIPVAAGVTIVDRPIADLLQLELAVGISDAQDPDSLVACGEIGGVLDANGAVAVGLAPMNDSSATGIAYIGPTNAGLSTGVSIFVQE